MRRWIALGLVVGGVALAATYVIFPEPRSDAGKEVTIVAPPGSDDGDDHHGTGSGSGVGCNTGCSLKKHYVAPFLLDDYKHAIALYKKEPMAEGSKGLETLLFYGERTRELMRKHGTFDLPRDRRQFLLRELSRTHATVTLRIVDDKGEVRASTGPMHVPVGQKQHLRSVRLSAVQSLEFNGTVMRVGLYHLWSRY
ncbi:MAG: hypothetical protein KC503_11785 [Myxococcales bacterium]|nr:hypothetical protein [Myxococcales bacterium]